MLLIDRNIFFGKKKTRSGNFILQQYESADISFACLVQKKKIQFHITFMLAYPGGGAI